MNALAVEAFNDLLKKHGKPYARHILGRRLP